MRETFADAGYWVALVDRADDLHLKAVSAGRALGSTRIVTTDAVLTEFLNHYSGYGEQLRGEAAGLVRGLLEDPLVEAVALDRSLFLSGLSLYERRRDKEYSLVDCISMVLMRERGITEVLTHDHHFAQEGFTLLL